MCIVFTIYYLEISAWNIFYISNLIVKENIINIEKVLFFIQLECLKHNNYHNVRKDVDISVFIVFVT